MARETYKCDGFELIIRRDWSGQPADRLVLRVRARAGQRGGSKIFALPSGNLTTVPRPDLVSLLLRRIAKEWTETGWEFEANDNGEIVG